MSVPKSRKSRSAVRRRRSHHHMTAMNIGTCEKCKADVLSHQACTECGFYKGRQAVDHTRDAQRAIAKQQHDHAHHEHEKPAAEAPAEKKEDSKEQKAA